MDIRQLARWLLEDVFRIGSTRELWEMSNIFPSTSGLPYEVWISSQLKSKPIPRVKVWETAKRNYSVAVTDTPYVIAGRATDQAGLRQVIQWILLNRKPIEDLWYRRIDGAQVGALLKSLKRRS